MKSENYKNTSKRLNLEEYYINLDIDQSLLYDKRIIWTNNAKNTPVELSVKKIILLLFKNSQNSSVEIISVALNNIICNLIWGLEQQKLIAIPLSKSAYQIPKFYGMKHYRYNYIVKPLKWLINNGYVNIRKGFFHTIKEKRKVSRIWASEKLIDLLKICTDITCPIISTTNNYYSDNDINITCDNFTRVMYMIPIILKDKNGTIVKYRPDDLLGEKIKFLKTYNEFIAKQEITVINPSIRKSEFVSIVELNQNSNQISNISSPIRGEMRVNYIFNRKLDCQLYRVYNNSSFEDGGRFYGATYQQMSEDERATILINGNKTVEIDYSALHGRMVYNLFQNDEYTEDPYIISSNIEVRNVSKIMFQIMLNTKSKRGALNGWKNHVEKNKGEGQKLVEILNKNNLNIGMVYDKLYIKHQKIKDVFRKKIGIKLQRIDSDIAESILVHLTKKEIVCLCVHDSFIVESKYANVLAEVMRKEYKKIIGFECVLKNWEDK